MSKHLMYKRREIGMWQKKQKQKDTPQFNLIYRNINMER